MKTGREKLPWEEDQPKTGPGKTKATDEADAAASVPPDYPLRWIDIDESDWPFKDFRDEYIRSKYLMDAMTLARRWSGLVDPSQIQAYFLGPAIEEERWAAQNSYGDPTDPEWRVRWNNDMVRRFEGIMQIAEQKIKMGGDVEVIGGQERMVPHSAKKLDSLLRQVTSCFEKIRLLQGESTAIIEARGNASANKSLPELLAEALPMLPPELLAVLGTSLFNAPIQVTATEVPRGPNPENHKGQLYEASPE